MLILVAGLIAAKCGQMQSIGWHISTTTWIDMWARWDSGFYLDIAASSYAYTPGQMSSVAFFPLYPLLMRTFAFGSDSRIALTLTGWAISNLATLIAFYVLYNLVKMDHNRGVARLTVWILAFFPTSFFFSVVYTEGLFLLLTVASFYFARQEKWLAATVLGGLSSATRSIGILIIIPLAVERYRQKTYSWRAWLPLVMIPMGLFGYMIFLKLRFGDPLLFSHAMSTWGRVTSIGGIAERFRELVFSAGILSRLAVSWLDLLFAIVAAFLIFYVLRKQRTSYFLYSIYALGIPLLTLQVVSIPRYVVVVFPIFLMLALWISRHRYETALTIATIGFFALLQIAFVVRWTLWYWVA